jgi:two-component system cell cycle response regulator DivK
MTGLPGPLILIVDDNEQNAKLARDVLRAAGFRTIEAVTGAEAIARATYDRQLNGDPRTTGIPIIALTALASHGAGEWWVDAGFDGYLEKPINVREFPDEVRRFSEG